MVCLFPNFMKIRPKFELCMLFTNKRLSKHYPTKSNLWPR